MKKTVLSFLVICIAITTIQAQNEPVNPFEEFGYKPKIATLSKGKYVEFYDQDTIVQIGGAVFNTVTMKIMGFVEYDTIRNEYNISPEVISRWLSPDPLTSEFPSWSPYNYVENNPIRMVDPTGLAPNEYDQVINEDGSSTTTKVSNLGGDAVDFTHITGGKYDGQTEIMSRATGNSQMMRSSDNFKGYTQRDNNTNWASLYAEFKTGTGPEKSLMYQNHPMNKELIQAPTFKTALSKYTASGKDVFGVSPSFNPITAGTNMTAQFTGKVNYSFYNVGDNLVIFGIDSKSITSESFNPIIKNNESNNISRESGKTTPNSTTHQTYLMILPLKK